MSSILLWWRELGLAIGGTGKYTYIREFRDVRHEETRVAHRLLK